MRFIAFEEKAEIEDQYPLSLNRDRDRLQKYWAKSIRLFHYRKFIQIFKDVTERLVLKSSQYFCCLVPLLKLSTFE